MSDDDLRPAADHVVPHPWVWAVLYFPLGLAIGFPSVALGDLGAQSDLGVSAVAGIVGMTFLANGWKFLWSTNGMLFTEALTGVAALVLFAFLARHVRGAEKSQA